MSQEYPRSSEPSPSSDPQQPQQPYGQPQWNQQSPPYPQQPMYQPQQQQPYAPIQPMAPAPKKKSGAGKKILITLGVVLLLGIGACALASTLLNTAVRQTTTGTISTGNTPSSSTNTNTQGKIGNVGDTITVDSVSTTLTSVKILAADDVFKAKQGNQFIVVHVKIHNGNTQQATYNPFDFHAKSGTGNVTNQEFGVPSSYTANNTLNSGQLDPTGAVEGDIVFQVPVGDHNAEITWQPNIFGNSTQNAWKLGL